ncbi:MAG: class I SAM-dependent rRNA methyltransferase [Treponema sp.]|nr:class I SAM-dependent rRNA methyltransferase [Treponema sp.]
MNTNNYPRVFLNAKEEKEILQGYPWVFDNEISHIKYRKDEKSEWKNESLSECNIEDGSAVEVFSKSGNFLGSGIINKKSKITIRLIASEHAEVIFADKAAFYDKKIKNAVDIRLMNYSEKDSYRLIFGEADFIPGFICERFCDIENRVFLVVQFLSLSCEVFREEILSALKKYCKPDGIFERSDAAVRDKEGLPQVAAWIGKEFDGIITILENGIKLSVDIVNGQKTGYFLDQKFNRARVADFCKGKKVLDTFTHTGGFGLNACRAGASKVYFADISPEACEMVKENISLNKFQKNTEVVCADVFDLLKKYEAENEKFDLIILDPPAFTKSAKMIEKAYGGYKEINLRAMRLLNEGGILVTCSCSYFMESHMFCDMIMHAAMDSHKKVQILEKRGAGPDHPVLLGYPKSEYLKCVICKVL